MDWKSSYSPEKAREYLSQFKGGKVIMEKDEKLGIAKVLIAHEEKKNAFTGKMMVDLEQVVSELEKWETGRLAIVEGAHGNFCSGGDLSFVAQISTPEDGYCMNTFMGGTLRRLRRLPIVTIANGQGVCLGGAAELFLSCDVRAVQHGAKIGFVQARLGVAPGWSGASRIVETLGRSKAIEVLATSAIFSAEEAIENGLASFLYKETEEFEKYITKYTKNSVSAMRACKQMIENAGQVFTAEEKHKAERDIFIQVWGGPDNHEALKKNLKHI
uniref:Enoyl-CoA hydratase/isomerase family protein n=1 Tax=Panagrolaimus sp. ES5 TaxID=591445 RepID=A0AC34F1B1_9BILA